MTTASAQAASPPWDDASITAIRRDMLRFARMHLRACICATAALQRTWCRRR